ncbi:uncharacterized protein FOMMEDRAFT_149042 [Fomitiporia mediterranea MF3/22]|uniref:uncharacterized protein n=1 Tax=Fomitiporia mediterranea (strain MF3/22) TaxID=694068 RepID=UPI0004407D2C|nr:uncharacterized protein FOMMEDRAFT_149042 [Fomitiporia mediterranea MF3/22]EJC98649.1 hypothetical protein FOMMEDRAFT_149042 [Fomitiporia mediterranea MF3/22]
MRRAQSLRSNNARNSTASLTDDLGVLKEQTEESAEDVLRKQLLTAERDNDKLKAQILSLQDQLSQRPPLEQVQELEREYKNLELLLTGTQRENERCMAELERGKNREKILERELTKLAGENWQTSLNIPPSTTTSGNRSSLLRPGDTTSFFLPQAESTAAVDGNVPFDESSASSFLGSPPDVQHSGTGLDSPSTPRQTTSAAPQNLSTALAHIAQVRALILGMEERMQARENRLTQEVSRAESETRRFETIRKEVDGGVV